MDTLTQHLEFGRGALISEIRFKHPLTYIKSRPTGSGNPTFSVRFLQKLRSLWNRF